MIKLNKTTQFLLPCLDIMSTVYDDDFIGCYLSDKDNQKYDFPILIIARLKEDSNLKQLPTYLEDYKKDDIYVYVFKIPEEHEKDYFLFVKGKYSELSLSLRKKIKESYGKSAQPYLVCMKDQERRKWLEKEIGQSLPADAELMSIIKEEEEII